MEKANKIKEDTNPTMPKNVLYPVFCENNPHRVMLHDLPEKGIDKEKGIT